MFLDGRTFYEDQAIAGPTGILIIVSYVGIAIVATQLGKWTRLWSPEKVRDAAMDGGVHALIFGLATLVPVTALGAMFDVPTEIFGLPQAAMLVGWGWGAGPIYRR